MRANSIKNIFAGKGQYFIGIFFLGTLWGLNEVLLGEFLYSRDIPQASVSLTIIALLILAVARGWQPRPGTATIIAGIATLFKLFNAAPFTCHLLGIFALGLTFDLLSFLLLKKDDHQLIRRMALGLLAPVISNAAFGLFMVFIARYPYWTGGGWEKILNHTFVTGGLIALFTFVLVPVGLKAGRRLTVFENVRPAWIYRGAFALSLFFWVLSRF
ncbi:hypothetical protein ACFLT9_00070 [Acidobacteriota bacterium]